MPRDSGFMSAKDRVLNAVRQRNGLTGREIHSRAHVGRGAVYALLEQLESEGAIASVADGSPKDGIQRRRYFMAVGSAAGKPVMSRQRSA